MPLDLNNFWVIIDTWSFKLRCWSTITPRNLALFTRCTTSFRKVTSLWGVRIFLRDNIIIWVLFTLRVSLLESNHNATFANSVFRISIASSIKSFWICIPLCHQQRVQKTRHYSSSIYHWCRWRKEGDQELTPVKHLYLNLMMLVGFHSMRQSVLCWTGQVTSDPSYRCWMDTISLEFS